MENLTLQQSTNGASTDNLAEWTVLVYMSSDNDLSGDCVWALTEMQKSDVDEKIAVVAQFDPPGQAIGTKQYDFTCSETVKFALANGNSKLEDFEVDLLTDDLEERSLLPKPAILPNRGPVEENFASADVLEAFLRDGIRRYKANHYLVILSGFGNGVTSGLLTDENPPGSMSVSALKTALKNTKEKFITYLGADPKGEIDILGLDSCLMGMVEVASELSGTVRYLVASEGTTPGSGWPYRQILENMKPEAPKEVAINILDNFIRFYSDYEIAGVSVDQSVCDLSRINAVERAVEQLVQALTDILENGELTLKTQYTDKIVFAHWKAQAYRFEQHVDLWDFCSCLKESLPDTDDTDDTDDHKGLRDACKKVMNAVTDVRVETSFSGVSFQHSHGLSVYFPWAYSQIEIIREYNELLFSRQTKWGEFLVAYVKDTQRKPRGPKFDNQLSIFPQDVLFPDRDNPRLNDNRDLPRVNDNRDLPRVNDNRDLPQVNNNRDLPQVNNNRDFIGGNGAFVLAPKVTNPPSHYYRDLVRKRKNVKGVEVNGHRKDAKVEAPALENISSNEQAK